MLLKERYGVTDFCGYVNLRSSFEFLRTQNDLEYSALLLEEEVYARYQHEVLDAEYLQWLEQEFGLPNLWPYIDMDRVLRYGLLVRSYPSDRSRYSHEDLLRIAQVTAKSIISFLDQAKPDVIFFSVVSNLGSMLLYHIARRRGIATMVLYCPRLGIKYGVSESYDGFPSLYRTFAELQAVSASDAPLERFVEGRKWLHNFQEQPTYYMNSSAAASQYTQEELLLRSHFKFLVSPRAFWQSSRWLLHLFFGYWQNSHRDDYATIKPWHHIIDKVTSKYRVLRGACDLYDVVDSGDTYAYFALHTEPEALPMLLAPFYTDQVWLIKQVARSLPVHFKLYVKDHPKMAGKRTRSYYQELKKIPNVKLINPAVSSLQLIEHSSLVLTLTGTSGWEGVLLKKPVIVFSKVFYSALSAVCVCQNIPELPYLIQKQLQKFVYRDNELVNFVAALHKECVDLDLTQIWDVEGAGNLEKKKQAVSPFVDLIARILHLPHAS
ncbi:MAG: hypothetical protein AAB932_04555 [Patescibacteria group bacterium]